VDKRDEPFISKLFIIKLRFHHRYGCEFTDDAAALLGLVDKGGGVCNDDSTLAAVLAVGCDAKLQN
jgi:hypothetical protein